MKRFACLVLVSLLAGCAHGDLKAPCSHPAVALFASSCGPLSPINR
ncbi:MAG: hypothetical protein JWR07_1793 [Nevskia sp.]|nr:hypothetical protein [Nevskia sp.]